jgi:peptide-methionine (S)-S-oxide reductase
MPDTHATATFGGGCFWCTEAVFRELRGVERVVSGYAGGHVENPSYEAVCTGNTGHAEVVQITYDPSTIGYRALLEAFFATHDPTTPNRQGGDVGTQYRSVIYYHDEAQRHDAELLIAELERERVFEDAIVTKVEPYQRFYPAEHYHQQYYLRNPNQGYCQAVIAPKLAKFRKAYAQRLKN